MSKIAIEKEAYSYLTRLQKTISDAEHNPSDANALQLLTDAENEWGLNHAGSVENRCDQMSLQAPAEVRKLVTIATKLNAIRDKEPEDAKRIATAYLRTRPAPVMVAVFGDYFPDLLTEARAVIESNRDLEILTKQVDLFQFLKGDGPPDNAAIALKKLAKRSDINQLIHFGIESKSVDEVRTAAALITYTGRKEFCGHLLSYAAATHPAGHEMVIMGAHLDPEFALQHLGKMLADAAYENPQDPHSDRSAQRARILVSARTIIPYIGSPLKEIGGAVLDGDLSELVSWVDFVWNGWKKILADKPQT